MLTLRLQARVILSTNKMGANSCLHTKGWMSTTYAVVYPKSGGKSIRIYWQLILKEQIILKVDDFFGLWDKVGRYILGRENFNYSRWLLSKSSQRTSQLISLLFNLLLKILWYFNENFEQLPPPDCLLIFLLFVIRVK